MPTDLRTQVPGPVTFLSLVGLEERTETGGAERPPLPKEGHAPVRHVVAAEVPQADAVLSAQLQAALAGCQQLAHQGASLLELERSMGRELVSVAQGCLAFIFASACRAAMLKDLQVRGLSKEQVRLRTDDDGYASIHTTFGRITFPIFAYRDLTTPLGSVTRHPAHALMPFHRECRSSPLCLEWEVRLGAEHPFRKAEELFRFFTRGAATIEDTSISRHMLALSSMVEPEWLYRKPDDIREALTTRATRDKKTNRPLLYISSDAHALRRYAGATWETEWKMVNGIRLWCEDAATGQIIHLGGEFTWGDCHVVSARIRGLIRAGILPNGDAAWAQVPAQLVFISDGADWFKEHILPHLPDAVVLLDTYHLIEWFAALFAMAFGAGTRRARDLYATLEGILFGKRPSSKANTPKPRRGHKKTRRAKSPHTHHGLPWMFPGRPRTVSNTTTCDALLAFLDDVTFSRAKHREECAKLRERLVKNQARMDYMAHLARGYQIGSGAMESMHRNGSQRRLKLPGARWLEDSSQAVLTFRMLELSGRWDEFWGQRDMVQQMANCFQPTPQPEAPPSMLPGASA